MNSVGKVLDLAQEFGCKFVISIGGFKKEEIQAVPGIYSTATDLDTMQEALKLRDESYGWTCFWNCRVIDWFGENQGNEGVLFAC